MNRLVASLVLICVAGCQAPAPYSGVLVIEAGNRAGTGFIVDQRAGYYYLVTARHVVMGYEQVKADGIDAKVVRLSDPFDLALILLPANKPHRVYQIAEPKRESECRAVGFAQTVGAGPAFMVYYGHIVCDDMAGHVIFNGGLSPGLSGGPLLDSRNRVVGIASRVGGQFGYPCATLGVFVPSQALRQFLSQ